MTVHYRGTLISDQPFGSSDKRGKPATFKKAVVGSRISPASVLEAFLLNPSRPVVMPVAMPLSAVR